MIKMRKRHGAFISILLAVSSLLVYGACKSPDNVKVEKSDDIILLSYEDLSVDETKEEELEKGNYEIEIAKTKGILNFLIQDQKDFPVFMGGSMEDGKYDLEIKETAVYRIILSGGHSAGTVTITRK